MLNLRAVTIGVPNDFDPEVVECAKRSLEGEFQPRTFRINLPIQPFDNEARLFGRLEKVSKLCSRIDVRWFNTPFDVAAIHGQDLDFLVTVLKRLPRTFINLIVAQNNVIHYRAIEKASKLIKQVSQLGDDGFNNFRVGVSCNPKPNTPFFPMSYSSNALGFSVALELSKLFNDLISTNKERGIASVQEIIIYKLVAELTVLDEQCKDFESRYGIKYYGIDLSLAPFPDDEQSVARLYQVMGLDDFGSNGTLFYTSFLTDIIKTSISKSGIRSVGFNGVMISMLEDKYLSHCNNKAMLSLDSLISYSSVCGCGLDMIPLPGDVFEEELSSLMLDIAGLSSTLNKPLGVRLLPIPGKRSGELTTFNMDFLCNSRVMKVKNSVAWNEIFKKGKFMYARDIKQLANDKVKIFWEKKGGDNLHQTHVENLKPLWYVYQEGEEDIMHAKLDIEKSTVVDNLNLSKTMQVLDLGSGNGYWSFYFSQNVDHVDGVDYCQNLVQQSTDMAKASEIDNVSFWKSPVQEFKSSRKYDLVFISGVLIYMNDNDVALATKNISEYSKDGSVLFLREGTGLENRHNIFDTYSEALESSYSAVYRTKEEYVESFEKVGFKLIKDADFFEEGSIHNKFTETRLRYYVFKKC